MLQEHHEAEAAIPSKRRKSALLSEQQIAAIMAFEAPYLTEKLLKERIFATEAEALLHFREVKRFLVMNYQDPRPWPMHSRLIDETWHQFVLFTVEYTAFCDRYFGNYLHHSPSNAPPSEYIATDQPTPSLDEFNAHYSNFFGGPPPDIWKDYCVITRDSRIVNERAGKLTVRVNAGRAELALPFDHHEPTDTEATIGREWILVRVDAWAEETLRFIRNAGAFYVRELPGELEDEERIALCSDLVLSRALRLAP